MTDLSRFQDCVVDALFATDASGVPEAAALLNQPGFAVYRNTVMSGCVDALQANYPAVTRLVGEDWLRAAATEYVRMHKPRDPCLFTYGDDFPRFLAQFAPAAELFYLPGVARLDRFWAEAHVGRDETALTPAALANLPPPALAQIVLHPHACARWAWFPEAPVFTIWSRNRAGQDETEEIDWHAEGALLARPCEVVASSPLVRGGCAFLDACAAGLPLAAAAEAALDAQPGFDLARLFAQLLEAGAFGRMSRVNDEPITKERS